MSCHQWYSWLINKRVYKATLLGTKLMSQSVFDDSVQRCFISHKHAASIQVFVFTCWDTMVLFWHANRSDRRETSKRDFIMLRWSFIINLLQGKGGLSREEWYCYNTTCSHEDTLYIDIGAEFEPISSKNFSRIFFSIQWVECDDGKLPAQTTLC